MSALFPCRSTLPFYPIMTVISPVMIGLDGPSAKPGFSTTMSPIRQAIMLLMRTVALPIITEPAPSAPETLVAGQACWSMTALQAGSPPIITLGLPGPGLKGLPWVVASVTRAAGGMLFSSRFSEFLTIIRCIRILGRIGTLWASSTAATGRASAIDEHHISLDGYTRRPDVHKAAPAFQCNLYAGFD